MPVVCGICREPLVYTGSDPTADKDALALTCGHIQHRGCLQKWFSSEVDCTQRFAACPICKIESLLEKAVQVYPTMDDDQMQQQLTAAQGRSDQLTTQNQQMCSENAKLKASIENQTASVDLLQFLLNDSTEKSSKQKLENGLLAAKNQKLLEENSSLKKAVKKATFKIGIATEILHRLAYNESRENGQSTRNPSLNTINLIVNPIVPVPKKDVSIHPMILRNKSKKKE